MNFVKVLIPLKGALKRVPFAVGGDNSPWVGGFQPAFVTYPVCLAGYRSYA
jgi:hypothetical protein